MVYTTNYDSLSFRVYGHERDFSSPELVVHGVGFCSPYQSGPGSYSRSSVLRVTSCACYSSVPKPSCHGTSTRGVSTRKKGRGCWGPLSGGDPFTVSLYLRCHTNSPVPLGPLFTSCVRRISDVRTPLVRVGTS